MSSGVRGRTGRARWRLCPASVNRQAFVRRYRGAPTADQGAAQEGFDQSRVQKDQCGVKTDARARSLRVGRS